MAELKLRPLLRSRHPAPEINEKGYWRRWGMSTEAVGGIGKVHRYPLAALQCMSEKREKEIMARLGGKSRHDGH